MEPLTEEEANRRVQDLVRRAWTHPERSEPLYREALDLLEPFARADDPSIVTITNFGALLCDTGEHRRAARLLKEAAQRDDRTAATHYNLAVALANLRDDAGARRHFEHHERLPADDRTLEAYFDPHGH
ncbi:MAG: tetratricopeptide repeat protein [Planctomycetota bacterium]